MTPVTTSATALDRRAVLERFTRIRARTRDLFDLVRDEAYYSRPIALRNPVVFYEGHLPAFAVNTLLKKALGQPGIDEHLETIFARGIDPETEAASVARGNPAWPDRATVRAFAAEADRRLADALRHEDLVRADHPLLRGGEAVWAILEHEEMHQETLLYMWHQLPYDVKRAPEDYETLTIGPAEAGPHENTASPYENMAGARENTAGPREHAASPYENTAGARDNRPGQRVSIPAGRALLGTPAEAPFAWDNERPAHVVDVPAFEIDLNNVTNAQYLAYLEANPRLAPPPFWECEGGTWYWRGMFERVPLPADWPVYVTWAEADAYARWSGGRLPTEPEYHRAAFGTPSGVERYYPWGDEAASARHGNFDFRRFDPVDVGSHPAGASAWGVQDLAGNGWEWTSTVFSGFTGFQPLASYPEYSADFFDGEHYVMKGASPATARELLRPGFRNWFRPRYPYVYGTFRCVR
jgi:gamma-glutamyl hercynylcysteine S-oxide synthase